MSEDDTDRFGPWRYITKIRVEVDRQRIEDDYSLDSLRERAEAEIESETVFRGFRQVTASTLDDSLPVVDTAEIPATARTDDRRSEIRTDGGQPLDGMYRCQDCGATAPTNEHNARGMMNRQIPCPDTPGGHTWSVEPETDRSTSGEGATDE